MTDQLASSLAQSREAIEKLVNLYLDNVPANELDREQLAETVYEGLSDELDRLYRIEATAGVLTGRWEQMAKAADDSCADANPEAEPGVVWVRASRARTYRKTAADLRDVLATGRIPHDLMTTAELGG